MIQQIKPIRCKPYLDFIRSKPCLKSGRSHGIVAAHQNIGYGRMAGKPSDLYAIPLHDSLHSGFGQGREHDGWLSFWSGHIFAKPELDLINARHQKEIINGWLAQRCLEYVSEYVANGGRFGR